MTFRVRLLLLVSLTVLATVVLVTSMVAAAARRAFETLADTQTQALIAQFQREYVRQGKEIVRQIGRIARADEILKVAIELSQPEPDYSRYVNTAGDLAQAYGLDFLELVSGEGVLVSSAHWPARFGYNVQWALSGETDQREAFLKREELPDRDTVALVAVQAIDVGSQRVYLSGGQQLDREFLASLVLPKGMRVFLYPHLDPTHTAMALIGSEGTVQLEALARIVRKVVAEKKSTTKILPSAETVHAMPLEGTQDSLMGVLLVTSSRGELLDLVNRIYLAGFLMGGFGILFGIVMTLWVAAKVTRPVEELARGANAVASGNWDVRVDARSQDELGQLASAFNLMTRRLRNQQERLIQAERVAAWRELARRLAHELKNPLFPLQITIENMKRAHRQAPEQFEEIFRESTSTLLIELEKLKKIISRFSDFARMPSPQTEPVQLNEVVRRAVDLFKARFGSSGDAPIEADIRLDPGLETIQADSDQLGGALQNLMLNAVDAMPSGGTLSVRTFARGASVGLDVSDTGDGLTEEECERLFTPYYTTREHGTGLGLAIVQSVVSDHHGKITVRSKKGEGTTFRLLFPTMGAGPAPAARSAAAEPGTARRG